MTKRLFAFESEEVTDTSNDLLIDKIIAKANQPKSPLSLTADLLKQRETIKTEVEKKLEDSDKKEDTDEASDTETVSKPDNTEEENKKEDSSDETISNKEETSNTDTEDTSKEEDLGEAAEDKESLNNLIGSALPKTSESKPSTESYQLNLINIFKPLHLAQSKYLQNLSTYALESQAISINKQKVVYVKESVIESINNFISLSSSYIENNKTFIANTTNSVKTLNERFIVFKALVEAEKFHFTHKLVSDKDILSAYSIPGSSDFRATIKTMINYIEASTNAITTLVSNPFDQIESAFTTNNFVKDDTGDLSFKSIIPGFHLVKVHLEPYKSYLLVNPTDYQYYKLKVLKTEDLFNLSSIGIAEDKELLYIVENINKLLINISIAVDNLNGINVHFTTFIDELKVIIYNVEQDKQTELGNLGIDDKLKDFIKFKLAIEAYYININSILEYISVTMSILNAVVELKE